MDLPDEKAEDAQATAQALGSPQRSASATSLPRSSKRSRKGFATRRRPGLRIQADDADSSNSGGIDSSHSDGTGPMGGKTPVGGTHEAEPSQEEEWWKREYRAPPPGHLGAHAVPVTASQEKDQKVITPADAKEKERGPTAQPTSSRGCRVVTENKRGFADRTARCSATASPGHPAAISSSHETPERAHRRPHDAVYSATTNHSSPSQKRKIIDLQDYDSAALVSMGVAKELKRFHEAPGTTTTDAVGSSHDGSGSSSPHAGHAGGAVTPSNLLCPMTKIALVATDATTTIAPHPPAPSGDVATNAARTAPKSA